MLSLLILLVCVGILVSGVLAVSLRNTMPAMVMTGRMAFLSA